MKDKRKRRPTDDLIAYVAKAFHVTIADLFRVDRHRALVHARTVACLMLKRDGLSYASIGRLMHRDHTSVMNLLKSHEERFRCFEMADIVERCDQYRLFKIEGDTPPKPLFITFKPAPRQKPRNVFRAKHDKDSAHEFHDHIAMGSRRLAEAIARARAA